MSAPSIQLNAREVALINKLVLHYKKNKEFINTMLNQVVTAVQGSQSLMSNVHSLRWRLKDPGHLKDKLKRKFLKAKKDRVKLDINVENLFLRINDLAGVRVLHLHTSQIVSIDRELKELFRIYRYRVIEDAKARTWDDEYRQYYDSIGIQTVDSPKMYTSVHYVISPNFEESVTCELQVRTLAEELWGEVDHSMNYPEDSKIEACRTQIKVLARVTSSCSRLVDSIYRTSNPKRATGLVPSVGKKSNGKQMMKGSRSVAKSAKRKSAK